MKKPRLFRSLVILGVILMPILACPLPAERSEASRSLEAERTGALAGPAITPPHRGKKGERASFEVTQVDAPNASGWPPPTIAAPEGRAPTIIGPLHTKGIQILDGDGRHVRLLGVGIEGMDSSNDDGTSIPDRCGRAWVVPNPETYDNIAAWGFNSVRLAVAWENLEPTSPAPKSDGTFTHYWNQSYVAALDNIVRQLTQRQIAVILDMHQYGMSSAFKNVVRSEGPGMCEGTGLPDWLFPKAAVEDIWQAKCEFFANRTGPGVPIEPHNGLRVAWQFLASRYLHNPLVVGADLFNEPYNNPSYCSQADLHLNEFYVKVGRAVREANPNLILFYEDTQAVASGIYGLAGPIPFPNSVYSFHLYEPDWSGPERLNGRKVAQAYNLRAKRWNVPVWIGEFDAFSATENIRREEEDPNWREDLARLMEYCRQQDIGWSVWAYRGPNSLVDLRTNQPKMKLIRGFQAGF